MKVQSVILPKTYCAGTQKAVIPQFHQMWSFFSLKPFTNFAKLGLLKFVSDLNDTVTLKY